MSTVEAKAQSTPKSEADKKPRHRSPNYPAVGLRDAVDRLCQFYKIDGKNGAQPKIVATHIGFSKPHGQAMAVVSALKKFGLIAEGQSGRLVPTQRGIEIATLSEDDPRREKALREAAVAPEIYQEIIKDYQEGGQLPSNDNLERELLAFKNFNPKSVTAFVRDFSDTLKFVGISEFPALESNTKDEREVPETEEREPKTLGKALLNEIGRGRTTGDALIKVGEKWQGALLTQTLVISIPRNFKLEIAVRGDALKKEDLAKIKSQFNRWIEGLEEAFE